MARSLLEPKGVTRHESARWHLTLASLESGETARAIATARDLTASLWERKQGEAPPSALREAFLDLLRRRGYFVSTPDEFATSLMEIESLGEGFDLHDLARQLATLDLVASQCLRLTPQPQFPELHPFAPLCPCGQHPLKSL